MANKGTKDIAGLYIGAVDVKGDVESANLKMSNSLSAFQPLGAVNPAPINAGRSKRCGPIGPCAAPMKT